MNNVDKLYAEHKSPVEFAKAYCEYIAQLLGQLDYSAIANAIELIKETREAGKAVYLIGNGGSAATASHMANDFTIGTTRATQRPFKFLSLTDNNAVMTAIANDFGYDYLFSKQLEPLLENGDLLIAISASGNSTNILKAIDLVKARDCKIIGITGFDGGELAKKCDVNLNVETPKGEYGPVEDIHMLFDHLISNYLMRALVD